MKKPLRTLYVADHIYNTDVKFQLWYKIAIISELAVLIYCILELPCPDNVLF